MWCRVAWEEVCSGDVEAIFAGELLQGVAPVSDDTGAATSVAMDGMGEGESEAQSVVELPCKATGSASAGHAVEPLWCLVRGAYVSNTHVVGEHPLLFVLRFVVGPSCTSDNSFFISARRPAPPLCTCGIRE